MKRLFVAIDFPQAIKDQLKPLCAGIQGAKWVESHQMHLTMRFIGDADEQQLTSIQTGLATVHATPFKMNLESVGQFPVKGRPRVIWVGVKAEPALYPLQKEIEWIMHESGFEEADHPFSPHITLARFKTPPPIEHVQQFFEQHQSFVSDTFVVDGFVLFSSQLTSSGSIYHPERLFTLI
ncbi:MAG: RNA 2',3'-cyclic phosphodiesterase [Anaerolineaceae bacterium]|nr:RNA 2',3'-cyclic phosphodiesterase [Anaerolineaceae bacterium]